MPYLTICTPTYNRAHTLRKVFDSLKRQSFKDFEWLIVDDGSTDHTECVVNKLKKEADFPIHYFWKENGGRHTALNASYGMIHTEYVINMDSDDEFTDDALQKIHDIWESIPIEEQGRFWAVSGRCMDFNTKQMIGNPWPEHINQLTGRRQRRLISRYPGEMSVCRKTKILREYPFPVFSDTKFVSECIVWERINQKFDQFCVNDIFRVFHSDSPDSLGAGKVHSETRNRSNYYTSLFFLNECFGKQPTYRGVTIHSVVNVPRFAKLSGVAFKNMLTQVQGPVRKFLVIAGYPLAMIYISASIAGKENDNRGTIK